MTESPNPTGGVAAPNDGMPGGPGEQALLDGGSGEAGADQWGPTRPPKTDAADDSAAQQEGVSTDDAASQPGRSVAAEDDMLAPQSTQDPTATSAGRSESAAGGLGS